MAANTVTVRLFGCLHTLRKERGLPTIEERVIPELGMTGTELAESLDLPLDMIEGIFCNRTVRPMSYVVLPGDRVAFVPKGTPGPHRFLLGLYAAGQESATDSEQPAASELQIAEGSADSASRRDFPSR